MNLPFLDGLDTFALKERNFDSRLKEYNRSRLNNFPLITQNHLCLKSSSCHLWTGFLHYGLI
ncbi:MAG: hypothetical protein WCE93_13310, partial [Nitrososphaeraceae archaeon]